jgi:hypothetical protein
VTESFFATVKNELVRDEFFETRAIARGEVGAIVGDVPPPFPTPSVPKPSGLAGCVSLVANAASPTGSPAWLPSPTITALGTRMFPLSTARECGLSWSTNLDLSKSKIECFKCISPLPSQLGASQSLK